MAKPGSLVAGLERFFQWVKVLSCRPLDLRQLSLINRAAWVIPLLFFVLLGMGLYDQALHPDFPPHHLASLPPQKGEIVLSGRLYRPTRVSPEAVRLYVATQALKSPAGWRPATGKLLVTAPPLNAPSVGSRVLVRGKLREHQALLNPGASDRPRQLAAEGIFRQMYVKDADQVVFVASEEAPSLAERLRGGIRSLLKELPPDSEAIYLSMLLGDQGRVTPEMRQNLSRTGTSHLLVINGMHLGAVAAITFALVFWLLRRFPWLLLRVNAMKIAALAAALPVLGYAHLAGGSPSTQRAEIMVLAYLLLLFLGRFRDIWSALTIAALWILVWNPLLLFSVSFQLSFAAVVGIVYLVPRLTALASRLVKTEEGELPSIAQWSVRGNLLGRLKRVGWRGFELLAVSFAASLAIVPLVAHHFQVVSLFGFLVNLAAIPLVLMMALPLGELAVLAQGLSLTTLANIFLSVGQMPLQWGYGIVSWVAGLPGSGINVPTATWFEVGLIYVAIFFLLPPRRSLLTWAGLGLCTVILAATLAWPLMTSRTGEITVLDSRTGLDGVLVAPGGQRLAFTAAWDVWPGYEGGGLGPLPSYLHWRQFRRLDAVLAFNLNSRNAGEVLTLAKQFEIGGVWWKGPRPVGKAIDLMNLLGDAGCPGLSLEKMNPPAGVGGMTLAYPRWEEGKGVALKVTGQGWQALIVPPLKRSALEKLPWPEGSPLTVLVAPGDVPARVLARLQPKNLICYGSREPGAGVVDPSRPTCLTRNGAVTLTFTGKGEFLSQWRP
jgi:ComEC/Rec2-related protein